MATDAHLTLIALADGPKSIDALIALIEPDDSVAYTGTLCDLSDMGAIVIVDASEPGNPVLDINHERFSTSRK